MASEPQEQPSGSEPPALRAKLDTLCERGILGAVLAILICGNALLKKGQNDEAIRQYQEAIRLRPAYSETLGTRASILAGQGKRAEAIRFYRAALKAQPDEVILNNLAWLVASCRDMRFGTARKPCAWQPGACGFDRLRPAAGNRHPAAAQAEAGDFPAAIATAERAATLATALGLEAVAAKNRELIQLFRQDQAFHEKQKKTTEAH